MLHARRTVLSVAVASALAAGGLGCVAPGGPLEGWPVPVSGDYVQPGSGARLPERLGALTRSRVTRWDEAESNVGVSYDDGGRAHVTAYVYPAGDASAGRLLGEFTARASNCSTQRPARAIAR